MRDFFYNKGDVLIAILIILVAAFVIYVRVGIIMEYSATGERSEGLLPLPFGFDGSDGQSSGEGENGGEGEGAVEGSDPNGQAPEQAGGQPSAASPDSIQITVNAGDAASTIADKLFAVGAIEDKQAFLSEVMSQGADSRLKMGTFVIPAGSSTSEIIAILTR